MKNKLINIQSKIDFFDENYKWAFLDIKEKYNIEIYNFYIKWNIEKDKIIELEKLWINMNEYIDEKDLVNKINELKKDNIKYYFNTYTENLIPILNEIKRSFWQIITKQPELFRNKKLQRELLFNYNKDYTVNYFEDNINNLDYEKIRKEIWVPFILKPKDWIQSSWVVKINNKKELEDYKKTNNLKNTILVEEFIDWDFFDINYYVDENQNIFLVPLIRGKIAIEYNIDDFFSSVRIISEESTKKILSFDIIKFVKETVKSCSIKNIFIHQEFKITSKNKIKNIEINWRIWWYRMEMYKNWYWINLLDLMFNNNYFKKNIKNNYACFTLYPIKDWILKKYNSELIENIKKIKSFNWIDLYWNSFIWKKIWLTKNWYKKVWKINLLNSNYEQFKKDLDFVEKKYKNLLILK